MVGPHAHWRPRLHALAGALALVLSPAAHALDFAHAFELASGNDAQLASARSQLEAVRERIIQARSQVLPSLGGQVQIQRQRIESNRLADTVFTSKIYGINLVVPVLRLQNLTQIDQAALQTRIAELQLRQTSQDLMVRVAQAYFDVLAAQDSLATVRAQREAIAEQLASARRNFEVGTATVTDQQEAQARSDLNRAQELAGANDLEVKNAALALLTGVPTPAAALSVLDKSIQLEGPAPAQETDWTRSGRDHNLVVLQAQIASEISEREIRRQRQGHLPTLDVIGSVGRQENPSIAFLGFKGNAAAIGVQINVPIYAGGGIDSKVREAALLRDKALSDLENYRRQAEQGARTAYLGVQSGLGQVRALEAAEASSRLALDSNRLGYQVGARINIDVLNAQQQLYSTRRDLSRARYDVIINGLRLKQAAGTLDEPDLLAVNRLLSEPPGDAAGQGSQAPGAGTTSPAGATVPGAAPPGANPTGEAPAPFRRMGTPGTRLRGPLEGDLRR